MKALLKMPSFLHGVAIALASAVVGSVTMFTLAGVLAGPLLLRLIVAALGLGYVLYTLLSTGVRVGKVSALLVWSGFTAVTLLLDAPLFAHLCTQVGLIWLLRALCVHRSVLPALVDLVLCTSSVAVAVWAAERTGSVFMAIWCLLLVQAAYVAIPRRASSLQRAEMSFRNPDERFVRAHRNAQAAVRRLSNAS